MCMSCPTGFAAQGATATSCDLKWLLQYVSLCLLALPYVTVGQLWLYLCSYLPISLSMHRAEIMLVTVVYIVVSVQLGT